MTNTIEVLTLENAKLIQQVKVLRHEVQYKDTMLHDKNLSLDAMYYVWCDGGCQTGVCRYRHPDLTEAMVEVAEQNTARLRRWWTNQHYRQVRQDNQG